MALTVSVIVPTYNRARLIERTIRSALGAMRPGDELIVVDDGSSDDTERVLKPYLYLLRYIRTENRGAGAARNRGIAEARNPLVAFLDSDDEWLPWRLDLARTLLQEKENLLFCYTDFLSDHGGKIVRRALRTWLKDVRPWSEIIGPAVPYSSLAGLPPTWPDFACHVANTYALSVDSCPVYTATITVRREAAGEALHFAEDVPTYEDWFCYSWLAGKGIGAFLDCETAVQHCHRAPRLTDADVLACATTRLRMLERIWGADPAFLISHGDLYRRVFVVQRIRRVKGLIKNGMLSEARAELETLPEAPGWYKAVAALPAPVVTGLFQIRGRVRAII